MMAVAKPITVLSPATIGVNEQNRVPRVELRDLFVPATEGECELVPGPGPHDQASGLVERLQARKVL